MEIFTDHIEHSIFLNVFPSSPISQYSVHSLWKIQRQSYFPLIILIYISVLKMILMHRMSQNMSSDIDVFSGSCSYVCVEQ